MKIGLLHPGEMGAAIGRVLVAAGHEVAWASAGRSEASRERAGRAGLRDLGTVDRVAATSEVVLSVCPPHAAREVAGEVAASGFAGVFVDANAVAPSTAREVAAIVEGAGARFVDGGIVGGPPGDDAGPRLFLSDGGTSEGDAVAVAALFDGTVVTAIVLDEDRFAASQLKMSYAAWTKGSAALLLTAWRSAERSGLAEPLREEWERSQPQLAAALARAETDADAKGWRWVGEMEEIAKSMNDLDLPAGFHQAAAKVFAG
jgi:3-hydroxyisobutyrate dehydrogenase-like beta-hydroxyacid dehydrogenase